MARQSPRWCPSTSRASKPAIPVVRRSAGGIPALTEMTARPWEVTATDDIGTSQDPVAASMTVIPRSRSWPAVMRLNGPLPSAVTRRVSAPSECAVKAAFAAGPPNSRRAEFACVFSLGPGSLSTYWIRSIVVSPHVATRIDSAYGGDLFASAGHHRLESAFPRGLGGWVM